MKDFFISYNRHDKAWAEWIAWTLEEAGYSTVLQAWDILAGKNFVLEMQTATSEAKRTIAVLSDTYLKSVLTVPEWAAAFAHDPVEKNRTLIPVRVKACQLTGLLAPIVYIDLVSVAVPKTIKFLRTLVTEGREGKEDSTSKQWRLHSEKLQGADLVQIKLSEEKTAKF